MIFNGNSITTNLNNTYYQFQQQSQEQNQDSTWFVV